MRLAWFTPWPPDRSGVAACSAELVPLLAARGHAIDVCVDQRRVPTDRQPDEAPTDGTVRIQSAHDFVWRQARGQYDLAVYQLGNSHMHEFMWPYLVRWPGLVVLHDTRLHHARARALLARRQTDAYRAEFAWNHPDLSTDLAELAVAGFGGAYYYQWPMRRVVLETARLVAVHARGEIDALRAEAPECPIEYVALGHGAGDLDVASARRRFRERHALSATARLVGAFGGLTAEKRVSQVLHAFAATRPWSPDARLVLVGPPDPMIDLPGLIDRLGLTGVTTVIPDASDREFDDALAACDVCMHLRWPTAGETSGPWLRALSAGRATVIIDLAHQRQVPALDPRTWRRLDPTDDLAPHADDRAITVAIDILDEDHSLRLALRRLVSDDALRARLGAAARRYWEREHTVPRMVDDYARLIDRARTLAAPPTPPLAHLSADGSALARDLLAPFGLPLPW